MELRITYNILTLFILYVSNSLCTFIPFLLQTGTLTEDGLDMWGVVAVSGATKPPRLGRPQRDPRQLNELHPLKLGMASCHSLTLLDHELAGDPLDLKV